MSEYTKNGGAWLGAARSWIQWHCHNGSSVTWGSGDVLCPSLTVRDVEDLAAHVADAAASEMDEMKKKYDALREKHLRLQMGLKEK